MTQRSNTSDTTEGKSAAAPAESTPNQGAVTPTGAVEAVALVPVELDDDGPKPGDRDAPPDTEFPNQDTGGRGESAKVVIQDAVRAQQSLEERDALNRVGASGGLISPVNGRLTTNGGSPVSAVPDSAIVASLPPEKMVDAVKRAVEDINKEAQAAATT